MALNAPELLRLLTVARARIAELESMGRQVVEVEVEKIVTVQAEPVIRYIENPELIEMIRTLQEKVCLLSSQ